MQRDNRESDYDRHVRRIGACDVDYLNARDEDSLKHLLAVIGDAYEFAIGPDGYLARLLQSSGAQP